MKKRMENALVRSVFNRMYKKDMSTKYLADAADVSQRAIEYWINGERHMKLVDFIGLADAVGLKVVLMEK